MTRRSRHIDALAPAVRAIVQRRMNELEARREDTRDNYERVLADLDIAIEGDCACGCGLPITDASASAYYATPECQHRWMAGQVTDPHDVYDRADAAAYPMSDRSPQSLSDPGHSEHSGSICGLLGVMSPGEFREQASARDEFLRCQRLDGTSRPDRELIYGPGMFPEPMPYRRACQACDAFMEPRIYDADAGVRAYDQAFRVYLSGPAWEQECSQCDAPLHATVHVPVIARSTQPAGWVLELHTRFGRVRSNLTDLALGRAETTTTPTTPGSLVTRTWRGMEVDLARFEREWLGRLNYRAEWQITSPGISYDEARLYFGSDFQT